MLAGPQSFMEWPAPPSGVVGSPATQEEEGMDISVLGVDLGKNVCSVVGLDASGAVVMRRKARRETLIALAEKLSPCVVGMEACYGAHHLGRVFAEHGHDVRLMSPEYVRPYIKAQKNDDRDAEGIAEAATRPTMRCQRPNAEHVGETSGFPPAPTMNVMWPTGPAARAAARTSEIAIETCSPVFSVASLITPLRTCWRPTRTASPRRRPVSRRTSNATR